MARDGLTEVLELAANFSSRWAPAAVLQLSPSQVTIFECSSSYPLNCSNSFNITSDSGESTNSSSSLELELAFESLTNSSLPTTNSSSPPTLLITPDLSVHHPLLGVLLGLVCLLVILGNALVMGAIRRERGLRTVTNYFVASLAAADCLVGALVMPFSVVHEVLNKWWLFGQDWCDLWHSVDVLASTASILNLCVISLDRYWAITDPISYPARMTSKKAKVLIALVWTCSALISFPAILWWRAVSPPPVPFVCSFTDDLGYLIFSSTISFYGPLVVMIVVYYRIYKAAVQQTRSIQLGSKCVQATTEQGAVVLRIHRGGPLVKCPSSSAASGGGEGGGGGGGGGGHEVGEESGSGDGHGSNSDRNNRNNQNNQNLKNWNISRKLAKLSKETKAAKTLGIVMGVFILCWLPFFVTNVLTGLCRGCISDPDLVGAIVTWLGWLNSAMNPVIYACWSRDFRRAFEKILCGHCLRRRRERANRQRTFARYAANSSLGSGSSRGVDKGDRSDKKSSAGRAVPMSSLREPMVMATRTSVAAIAVAEVAEH